MKNSTLYFKVTQKLWSILVKTARNYEIYPYIYRSFWHHKIYGNTQKENSTCFFSAQPNPGAGIGHQLANWIAGYWFCQQFGLKFAHIPFSTLKWESTLGFGENETKVNELKAKKYKIRKLPLFDEKNQQEVNRVKSIIASYSGKKIIFLAEQDQFYQDQFGVIDAIKQKFNQAASRKEDHIIYDPNHFNIAVHVRRTVIIGNKTILESDEVKAMRWLNNNYYEIVIEQAISNLTTPKRISIYIFSTGKAEEFAQFKQYGDVHFCSDMDEYASFLHLIRADLLITSKSSFSYKPALLNDGIKICPRNFWHNYPDSPNWILVENDGKFDTAKLKKVM